MGRDITHSHFKKVDFDRYSNKLSAELDWVCNWFKRQEKFTANQSVPTIGFEMEMCLIDRQGDPASSNEQFLTQLKNSDIVSQITPELAQFNIELNGSVFKLTGTALGEMAQELQNLYTACQQAANTIDCDIVMIGSLPTLQEQHLQLENMSHVTRYQALNEQVLRSRKGKAIELDIQGRETLKSVHFDVMLESVATSFQLHLQMPFLRSVRYYNAAIILSAPIVSVSANSPFLFGKDLWSETRIPVFEQAVAVGGYDGAMFGPVKRVSFGSDYAHNSLLECFVENNEHYPVLLPELFNTATEDLEHLSLHNGTIWRWNRPLIAYVETEDTDKVKQREYHLRLEHRVIPSGPTVVDSIANAAFFYGAITALANQSEIPEQQLSFGQAKDNFYLAAKQGLKSRLSWLNGEVVPVKTLILDTLLPMAKEGLQQMGVEHKDIQYYLDIIEQRVSTGQNGATWQRRYIETHGKDMRAMTLAYLKNQKTGKPVHSWSFDKSNNYKNGNK